MQNLLELPGNTFWVNKIFLWFYGIKLHLIFLGGRGGIKRDDRGYGGRGMSRGGGGMGNRSVVSGNMNRGGDSGDRRNDRNDRQRDSAKRSRFSDGGPGKSGSLKM